MRAVVLGRDPQGSRTGRFVVGSYSSRRTSAVRANRRCPLRFASGRLARPNEPKNVANSFTWVEPYVVAPSAPGVANSRQQIFHFEHLVLAKIEVFQGNMDHALMHLLRIEIDNHDQVIARNMLVESDDLFVFRREKAQIPQRGQSGIFSADSIESGDVVFDIAELIPFALANLVLLGIEVLLAASGERTIFAQLKPAV